MTGLIRFEVPKGFKHFAGLHISYPGPTSDSVKKYSMRLPVDTASVDLPEGCMIKFIDGDIIVNASSKIRPIIYVDPKFRSVWEILKRKASEWNFPVDRLLRDRPMTVAVEPFYVDKSPMKPFTALSLIAVQIGGDLSKSDLLDEHINSIKENIGVET